MTYRYIAAAVTCLVALCVWPVQPAAADEQSQRPPSIPPPPNIEEYLHARRVSEALSLHGMQEAAKVNGGEYVIVEDINSRKHNVVKTLSDLVALGEVIIAGTVQSAVAQLSEDGRLVETSYGVTVKEALKGSVSTTVVQIRIRHGRMTFSDGTAAEIRTPGFSIEIGRQYIFWIRLVEGKAYYGLSPAVTQGVIDISEERARSLTSTDRPIKAMLEGKEVGALMTELRAAITERESRPRAIGVP